MCFGSSTQETPRDVPARQARHQTQQGIPLVDMPSRRIPIPPQARQPDPQKAIVITTSGMSDRILSEACEACADALVCSEYAIIGGAACKLLGSSRGTADIDLIVADGQKRSLIRTLGNDQRFGTDSRRTWFRGSDGKNYNVDILESKTMYHKFDAARDVIRANECRILRPELLLNSKCLSWGQRDKDIKKANDARDISFLVAWLAAHKVKVAREAVPFADDDFLFEFASAYPETARGLSQIGLRPGKSSSGSSRGSSYRARR